MSTKSRIYKVSAANGEVLGLAIISAEAGFGVWSALLPSIFTIQKFAGAPQDLKIIRDSVVVALGVMGVTALGIKAAFGKRGTLPALTHFSTGLGLTVLYGFKIGWRNLLGL